MLIEDAKEGIASVDGEAEAGVAREIGFHGASFVVPKQP